MAPTDSLKEFSALQRIADQSSDHQAAVSYVQCRSEEGRCAQRAASISALVAAGAAAVLRERLPEASVLAGMVASITGILWCYGNHVERHARHHLSTVHAARIRMILQLIRTRASSLAGTVDQVEASLFSEKS